MTTQSQVQKVLHPTYGVGTIVDDSLWGSIRVNFSGMVKQVATARVTFIDPIVEEYVELLKAELESVKEEGMVNTVVYKELAGVKDIM